MGSSASSNKSSSSKSQVKEQPKFWHATGSKETAENAVGLGSAPPGYKESEQDKQVEPLEVESLNLQKIVNKFYHRTDEYEHDDLIVRRGEEFLLKIKLKDNFNNDTDKIRIKLITGDRPRKTRGTLVEILVGDEPLQATEWGAIYDDKDGAEIKVKVMPAADAIVGRYRVFIDTRRKLDDGGHAKRRVYKHTEEITLLFNAWCKEDTVYLSSDDERKEYVLNESGRIYTRVDETHKGKAWNFGQFQKESLDCALFILDNSGLSKEAMCNPVRVIRTLSAKVNSFDEGVLMGNWSGNYADGTRPTSWAGSAAILEEYMQKKSAVKFGQCWVFSGVCTTVCRALGIPARSVTNFSSAHDQDESMTIDKFVDCNGKPLNFQSDSVWNFHVWNEAWLCRPDLPEGNDGWQAFDATPQERSDGQYQCGPCPVAAIKRGDVFLNYDAKFIFAEVNGDEVVWMMNGVMDPKDENKLLWNDNDEPDMKAIEVDADRIGQRISTKKVGVTEREIVTDNYKHKDGSKAERMTAGRVSLHSSKKKELAALYELEKKYDVSFVYEGEMDKKDNIKIKVTMTNTGSDKRSVNLQTHSRVKYYAGTPGEELGDESWDKELEPAAVEVIEYKIAASRYINTLTDDGGVVIQILARIKETSQISSKTFEWIVEDPDLELSVDKDSVKQGDEFEVTVKIENPLDVSLTECELRLEGPGTLKSMKVPMPKTVEAEATIEVKHKLKAKYKGKRELIGLLTSKQLRGLTGSVVIEVLPIESETEAPPAGEADNTEVPPTEESGGTEVPPAGESGDTEVPPAGESSA